MPIALGSGFTAADMTENINLLSYAPGYLASLNGGRLFTPKPISTTVAQVVRKNGRLALIQSSERGAPDPSVAGDKRKAHYIPTTRVKEYSRINASEIQDVLAGGSVNLLTLAERVTERQETLLGDASVTLENHMLGAVQGIVLDADATPIVNFYDQFGVIAPTEIAFNIPAPGTSNQNVKKACNKVTRQMQDASKGMFLPTTQIFGLADDTFFDALTECDEVQRTYLNQTGAAQLREGTAYSQVNYGGITFVNYRGLPGTPLAIGAGKVKFFPVGARPEMFQWVQGPGETFDDVNRPGLPFYSWLEESLNNTFMDVYIAAYPLFLCAVPEALASGRVGA